MCPLPSSLQGHHVAPEMRQGCSVWPWRAEQDQRCRVTRRWVSAQCKEELPNGQNCPSTAQTDMALGDSEHPASREMHALPQPSSHPVPPVPSCPASLSSPGEMLCCKHEVGDGFGARIASVLHRIPKGRALPCLRDGEIGPREGPGLA